MCLNSLGALPPCNARPNSNEAECSGKGHDSRKGEGFVPFEVANESSGNGVACQKSKTHEEGQESNPQPKMDMVSLDSSLKKDVLNARKVRHVGPSYERRYTGSRNRDHCGNGPG